MKLSAVAAAMLVLAACAFAASSHPRPPVCNLDELDVVVGGPQFDITGPPAWKEGDDPAQGGRGDSGGGGACQPQACTITCTNGTGGMTCNKGFRAICGCSGGTPAAWCAACS